MVRRIISGLGSLLVCAMIIFMIFWMCDAMIETPDGRVSVFIEKGCFWIKGLGIITGIFAGISTYRMTK